MNASEMPLIGALFLAVALTANYFLAFWRMDPSHPKSERARTPRRQIIACSASAVLPLVGALAPLSVSGLHWTTADAPLLALARAGIGFVLHALMDKLMVWGTPVASR